MEFNRTNFEYVIEEVCKVPEEQPSSRGTSSSNVIYTYKQLWLPSNKLLSLSAHPKSRGLIVAGGGTVGGRLARNITSRNSITMIYLHNLE